MLAVFCLLCLAGLARAAEEVLPKFQEEPPSVVTFLNSTGATIRCRGPGELRWTLADGSPAGELPGLRTVLANGTLRLLPFSPPQLRQDVHLAVYRCLTAVPPLGRLASRDVRVRAVLLQGYQAQVYDEFVIRGNTAVLRCHVPSHVSDVVTVSTWRRQDGVSIVSNIASGGRFSVLPNGELHIRDTILSDGFKSYRCVTRHAVSGHVQVSMSSGRLILTDPQGSHPPRLADTRSLVEVREGDPAEMTCVAQAYPLPVYRWYKKDSSTPLSPVPGVVFAGGSFYIEVTRLSDAGTYVCDVSNDLGHLTFETTLVVTAPLSARVTPPRLQADVDKSATLTCAVSGRPTESVRWLKDGVPLLGATSPVLRLARVRRQDRGIFQCLVSNGRDSAQAAALLELGESPPVFLETFSSQIVSPGDTVSLGCVASGSPLPQVTWTLDGGFPVPDDERVRVGDYVSRSGAVVSHVNLTRAAPEDGGVYGCRARNDVGTVLHVARLDVRGPPRVKPMPDLAVVAGERAELQCRVAGHPIRTITWEKDSRKLPTNRRQQAFPNGTLLITRVQRVEDEGSYTCVVQGEDGTSAQGTLAVRVKEKPVILPFSFPEDSLKEGMKVRVVCTVAAGDPPFRISWSRDGRPLESGDDTEVKALGDDFSVLTIASAAPRHSGIYACVVSNDAATVNYSATLMVQVPPRWQLQPTDTSVLSGHTATLHCQASGYPQPQIRWEKAKGNPTSRDYHPIHTNFHYQIFENGSLTIQDVSRDDAGYYLCQATNGIGPGLSSVINLAVHEPPRFEAKFRTQLVKKCDSISVSCAASGDQPLTLSWSRDKQPLPLESDVRLTLEHSEAESRLSISPLKRSDSALYTCTAVNSYGQDDTNIQLIIQEPPDAPRDVVTAEMGSRQAKLSWDPPFSGNSLISHYLISFRKNDTVEWTNTTVPGSETGYQLTELHPSTGYLAVISAHNSVGPGPSSSLVAFTTLEEAPEAPPRNVHVFPTGPDSLRVNWEGPLPSQTNGPLAGYYVGYRPANSSEPLQYKSVEAPWAELRGLDAFTLYSVVVQAFNGAGAGPRADPVMALTLEGVPKQPPKNVECSPQGTQTLHVTWSPVPENDVQGVLRGYKVLYATSRDYSELEVASNTHEATLTDLAHYTNYSLALAAFTAQGDGVYSDTVYCATLEDVPSSPADIRAVPMLPDAILVSWLPPLFPNGIILNYFLYQRTNHQGPKKHLLSGSQQFYEALRLTRGQRYDFWVTAATAVGEGEPTRVLSQTTSDIVPARIASFSEVLEILPNYYVQLPCKYVGIPAPELTWTFKSQPVKENILPNGTLNLGPYDPQAHTGNYSCRVQNVHGTDEIAFFLTSHSRMDSERDSWIVLSVTSTTTNSLDLTWEQLLKPPFRPKEYVLRYKREFGQWEEIRVASNPPNFSLTGLRCGTVYSLYLARRREDGSPPSNVVTARTLGSAPVAPDKEAFLMASNSSGLLLALGQWEDGGCPVKSFVVRYKSFWSTEWRVPPSPSQPSRPLFIGGLAPATWYHLRVTAHNGAGSTAAEYEMATLTWDGVTIAPLVPLETRETQSGWWEDVHLAVPVVVAVVALLVVGGVALCVCFKRRHFQEDIYERPAPLQRKSLPCSTGKSPEGTQVRETSLYQTCLAKGGPPPTNQPPQQTPQDLDYEDDITPYATFRVPGFDSDTESSQGTVRELQTFHEPHMRLMKQLQDKHFRCKNAAGDYTVYDHPQSPRFCFQDWDDSFLPSGAILESR